MLTGLKEGGKTKCDLYWPNTPSECYQFENGKYAVTLKTV